MRRPGSTPSAADPVGPVRVDRIGRDGDGLALLPDGRSVFLPYVLPGELVQPGPLKPRGKGWAAEATVVEPSPARAIPPCPHFGTCGGCTLQHWQDEPYFAWKAAQLDLAWPGLQHPPLSVTPPGARRRVELAIQRVSGGVRIGLHRRRSTEIVDMQVCPVLQPALVQVVTALRAVLPRLSALRRAGSAVLNGLDSGPDLLLRTDHALTSGDRTLLAAFAARHGLARIAWAALGSTDAPEPACQLRPASISFNGFPTAVPPGAFLQASRVGEDAITAALLSGLPPRLGRKSVILELFAGCGSLTHALSTRARVRAYEGHGPAATALRSARNPAVEVVQRDLARQPIQASDLAGAACVVLDPPYDGAAAQMPALAAGSVPVLYVSCNPSALARDAQPLRAAGFQVEPLACIDQFRWSTHVESVTLFTPGPRR